MKRQCLNSITILSIAAICTVLSSCAPSASDYKMSESEYQARKAEYQDICGVASYGLSRSSCFSFADYDSYLKNTHMYNYDYPFIKESFREYAGQISSNGTDDNPFRSCFIHAKRFDKKQGSSTRIDREEFKDYMYCKKNLENHRQAQADATKKKNESIARSKNIMSTPVKGTISASQLVDKWRRNEYDFEEDFNNTRWRVTGIEIQSLSLGGLGSLGWACACEETYSSNGFSITPVGGISTGIFTVVEGVADGQTPRGVRGLQVGQTVTAECNICVGAIAINLVACKLIE